MDNTSILTYQPLYYRGGEFAGFLVNGTVFISKDNMPFDSWSYFRVNS